MAFCGEEKSFLHRNIIDHGGSRDLQGIHSRRNRSRRSRYIDEDEGLLWTAGEEQEP